jgi:ectoine hydroxylase-related dioxygenase (phytanoyl-CoA dioxygenase family)
MTQGVTLDGEYAVSDEQVARFRDVGHVLLPGLLGADEIGPCRDAIVRAVERSSADREMDNDGVFLQVVNVWERDDDVRQFVTSHRFSHAVARLLGVGRVRLYYDQALFKLRGDMFTPWHQDAAFFPVIDSNAVATLWIPLVDVAESLQFVSGMQRTGLAHELAAAFDSTADEYFEEFVAREGLRVDSYGPLRAGNATLHDGWTLHRAPGHQGVGRREVMTIIFYADGARLLAEQPERVLKEVERLGWTPGELAASDRTPLLG